MNALLSSLPQLAQGFSVTALLFVCAFVLGLMGGVLILIGRTFGPKWLKCILWLYTTFFRSVPLVMVLLFYYLALPNFFDKNVVAIIAFGFFEAAYFGEILRAGMNTLQKGQREAGETLGLSKLQTFRYVLLPQVFKASKISIINQAIILFQDTSLVYVIGAADFFTIANRQGQQTGELTAHILFAGSFYLIVSILATRLLIKTTTRRTA